MLETESRFGPVLCSPHEASLPAIAVDAESMLSRPPVAANKLFASLNREISGL